MVRNFLFIEGGSSNGTIQEKQGFVEFLRKAKIRNPPRIVLAGPRHEAIRQYVAHRLAGGSAKILVDAEGPVNNRTPIAHLKDRGDLATVDPVSMSDDEVFLMIETMECWLIADIEAIKACHPKVDATRIVRARARVGLNVECISKAEAESLIQNALPRGRLESKASRMGLVGLLDPAKVRSCTAEATRFLDSFT